MTAEFNYKRAWLELAKPEHDKLCAEATALYDHIVDFGREWTQDSNLQVPVLDRVRPLFEAIPSYALAVASRTIYYWGHWAHAGDARVIFTGPMDRLPHLDGNSYKLEFPAASQAAARWHKECVEGYPGPAEHWELEIDRNGPAADSHGAHWKFSNMADQILRERLGLGVCGKRPQDTGFDVGEGVYRLTRSAAAWDLGWATEETQTRVKEIRAEDAPAWDDIRDEILADDLHKCWFDTSQFMDHKHGTDYTVDELPKLFQPVVAEHFIVMSASHVNFKPHPFTIGVRHMLKDSMTVDPTLAPCAAKMGHEMCRLSYAEHTYDTVVFLQCKHDVPEPVASECLRNLEPLLKEHKCDGVTFVEHPDGYKIVAATETTE